MIATSDPTVLRATISDPEVIHSILLTLSASWWATLACLLFGVPLAYVLARWNFFGKAVVQGVIDLPVMIPHATAGIALLMVYGPEFMLGRAFAAVGLTFTGTVAGISLAMAFVSLPFLVNAARDGFLAIDPRLERVARTLGASPWQAFFRVSLALSWRSVLSGAIMMWARGIAEFGAVSHPGLPPHGRPYFDLGAFPKLWAQICLSRSGDFDPALPRHFFRAALACCAEKGDLKLLRLEGICVRLGEFRLLSVPVGLLGKGAHWVPQEG